MKLTPDFMNSIPAQVRANMLREIQIATEKYNKARVTLEGDGCSVIQLAVLIGFLRRAAAALKARMPVTEHTLLDIFASSFEEAAMNFVSGPAPTQAEGKA